jgi:hypothetical protein
LKALKMPGTEKEEEDDSEDGSDTDKKKFRRRDRDRKPMTEYEKKRMKVPAIFLSLIFL